MGSDEASRLNKLSVKELRRQAAVKNVPLTQISAAVEKAELINLIIRAGPVLDTYDVHLGAKVHSATSIAERTSQRGQKKKEKDKHKKKKRRHSSSSSSRSSRGRDRKRRSRSKPRAQGHKKKSRSRQRGKSGSRSPSLTIIMPPQAPAPPSALRALPAPGASSEADVVITVPPDPVPPPAPAKAAEPPSIAQKGMAAAAALGFDVLPKAPVNKPAAPAEGLRPTINSGAPAPLGAGSLPGGRICIQYLCTSKCDLGGKCPQAHIIDPEEEMRVRARFKEQECHYGAQCSRPGCLFRHPGERLEEGQFIPEGQQVTLRATPQGMQMEYV